MFGGPWYPSCQYEKSLRQSIGTDCDLACTFNNLVIDQDMAFAKAYIMIQRNFWKKASEMYLGEDQWIIEDICISILLFRGNPKTFEEF